MDIMSHKSYNECDVCGNEEREKGVYKKRWIRVSSPDPSYSHKKEYSFFKKSKTLDICSADCLEEIQKDMWDEEVDVLE